eukprot:TRINITY_DN4790_c0_g1_i3.p1 TRINITY_DN4790_c0_g1~~TRINITY_DN4790_c0_g1_i3.p1  ORF type:complete len:202 (+),score=42.86 TRINITY_DN4790_c0_g1_i3:67-672(+)
MAELKSARQAVEQALGKKNVKALDTPILDYIVSTVEDYKTSDGTIYEMIGDLLSDTSLFKNEEQITNVCKKIESLMFGTGTDLATVKVSSQPQKLKQGPFRMGGEEGKIQSIEAEMSLYSYMPAYEKARRAGKTSVVFFTREEEAQSRRIKAEARQRVQEERQENERLSGKTQQLPMVVNSAVELCFRGPNRCKRLSRLMT